MRRKKESTIPAGETKIVPVKLTPTERATLDKIVYDAVYASRSSAMRAALGLLFDLHKVDAEADRRIESERRLHLPRGNRKQRQRFEIENTKPKPTKKGKK